MRDGRRIGRTPNGCSRLWYDCVQCRFRLVDLSRLGPPNDRCALQLSYSETNRSASPPEEVGRICTAQSTLAQTSACSEISRASSTSMPRYRRSTRASSERLRRASATNILGAIHARRPLRRSCRLNRGLAARTPWYWATSLGVVRLVRVRPPPFLQASPERAAGLNGCRRDCRQGLLD